MIFVWSHGMNFRWLEREAIKQAMVQYHGNTARVARALGVSRATIYRKIDTYFTESQKNALLPQRNV